MKLHPDHHDDLNAITAYGTGWVEVNGARHQGPLLLHPQGPVQPWSIDGLAALTPDMLLASIAFGVPVQFDGACSFRRRRSHAHCCRPASVWKPWTRWPRAVPTTS